MNWIPYNPADAFYKSVPGAVETDRPFRLRLILPRAFGATGAHFVLQRDGGETADHPMYWAGMDGDDKEIWDIELAVPEKGLYFYHFDYDSSWGRGSVFHSGDGIGALPSAGARQSWQLTVYDKNLHTPDWLKGGIFYQ